MVSEFQTGGLKSFSSNKELRIDDERKTDINEAYKKYYKRKEDEKRRKRIFFFLGLIIIIILFFLFILLS